MIIGFILPINTEDLLHRNKLKNYYEEFKRQNM